MDFEKTDRNQVRRVPGRGHYDRQTIYEILDAAFVCHVGFSVDQQPFVIPTLYGRAHDSVFLHGSAASRMLDKLSGGIPVCLTVTHIDGLVLARSAFHHSMNYRSAVVFGTATEVHRQDKLDGLVAISEQVLPGRWREARRPNDKELQATTVLRVDIESASAKIRTGPPSDDAADYDLPIWAGEIPIEQTFQPPISDAQLSEHVAVPPSVRSLLD